jgi:ribosomal protein S18 acetylase RimI-like enzyme
VATTGRRSSLTTAFVSRSDRRRHKTSRLDHAVCALQKRDQAVTGERTPRARKDSAGRGKGDSDIRIEPYAGSREALRGLFELAEDSPSQLASYLGSGRVVVALSNADVIGHLQLVATDKVGEFEIKNMAVLETHQGRGVGCRLVRTAIEMAAADGGATVVVATAAADIDNLRFYQRQGFRMRAIERDAFTPASGYPPDLLIDGIALRDRVWLDYQLDSNNER